MTSPHEAKSKTEQSLAPAQSQTALSSLKVLFIESSAPRAKVLKQALTGASYQVVHVPHSGMSLLKEVERQQPDLIMLDIESPDRDMLDSLSVMTSINPKPVVMFSGEQDAETINQLIRAGVSAYVVGDVSQARVRTILNTAIARFTELQQLKQELADTKHRLSAQKALEQAKIWLMESQQITEQEAYGRIRKMAMNNGQKIEETARTILSLTSLMEPQK